VAITTHWAPELRDAPPAVIALALEGKAELQGARDFPIRFLAGGEIVAWCESDGMPVGVLIAFLTQEGRALFTDELYVCPAFRGMGIYSRLRERQREIALADSKIKAIEWVVRTDNETMIKLQDRHGVSPPSSLLYRFDLTELRTKG
jgi:GNAT superfamily N-acetyltransferase